jgi:L-2-hydroxycarboxylate dehydrogenase (NAD+)
MIDRQGKPLLDPQRADEGFLLPIGGYKGYGLALIVGLLAGTLQGAAMGRQVVDFNKDHVSKTNTGQAILVIDLKAFGDPALFKAQVDTLVRDLRNGERLQGVERIWLPGEQSYEKRERYRAHGIPVAAGVMADLALLAIELGIEPLQA